jgi:large subunit ribosomal protein L25
LKVMGLPKDMPDHIDVDCSELDFHHSVKVGDIKIANLTMVDPHQASIAVVEVPRAAKMAAEDAAKAAETAAATPTVEGAAPAAGAAAGAAPAADAKKEAPKKDEGKKK